MAYKLSTYRIKYPLTRTEYLQKVTKDWHTWTRACWAHNPKKGARQLTVYAIKKGKIVKPKQCEKCGKPEVHAHHNDYSKWWEVTWVCHDCHLAIHSGDFAREFNERRKHGLQAPGL